MSLPKSCKILTVLSFVFYDFTKRIQDQDSGFQDLEENTSKQELGIWEQLELLNTKKEGKHLITRKSIRKFDHTLYVRVSFYWINSVF